MKYTNLNFIHFQIIRRFDHHFSTCLIVASRNIEAGKSEDPSDEPDISYSLSLTISSHKFPI